MTLARMTRFPAKPICLALFPLAASAAFVACTTTTKVIDNEPDAGALPATDASSVVDASTDAGSDAQLDNSDASDDGAVASSDASAEDADADDASDAPVLYTIGGAVSGLAAGDTLTLIDNASDPKMISANGPFTFAMPLASGAMYTVSVSADPTTPTAQDCTVTNGIATVAAMDVANVIVTCTNSYFVDPSAGSDSNSGTSASPWKTLTHAVATVPAAGASIHLRSPASTAETFPIVLRSNQTIMGGVGNAVQISGSGLYTATESSGTGSYTLVVSSGASNVTLRGLEFGTYQPGQTATSPGSVLVDHAAATFVNDQFGNGGGNQSTSCLVLDNGSIVTVSGTQFASANVGITTYDATTALHLRGSSFAAPLGVVLNGASLANFDFGTTTDHGGNVFSNATQGRRDELTVNTGSGTLSAVGNSWIMGVQGADTNGEYASSVVSGPTSTLTGDQNYSLPTGASLQF